jgi:hypothetical protein
MKTFLYFALFMFLALIAIVIGVIIGDYGSWYFAWLVGSAMIVLIAVAGGTLFDAEEDERKARL